LLLGLIHWNPHWQCFVKSPDCAVAAPKALDALLTPSQDFANVIEMESSSYEPPTGWAAIGMDATCGNDWDTLLYNADRWTLERNMTGCLVPSRSFAAGIFSLRSDPSVVLAVVGAHFPQTLNASTHAYEDATAAVSDQLRTLWDGGRTVFMADTNTEGPVAAAAQPSHHGVNRTNGQLLADIGLWPSSPPIKEPPAAPLYLGCCYSDNFSWQGDRIVANFGTVRSSRVLFDPVPDWAAFEDSEFHKGVQLELAIE